jgi:hypothetical protein
MIWLSGRLRLATSSGMGHGLHSDEAGGALRLLWRNINCCFAATRNTLHALLLSPA